MKFKVENCNYYVVKELLETSLEHIDYVEKINPETTLVKLKKGSNQDDLMNILSRHPLPTIVS